MEQQQIVNCEARRQDLSVWACTNISYVKIHCSEAIWWGIKEIQIGLCCASSQNHNCEARKHTNVFVHMKVDEKKDYKQIHSFSSQFVRCSSFVSLQGLLLVSFWI